MAELRRLMETKNLKTALLESFATNQQQIMYVNYDDSDELIILFVNPETESIAHYIDPHVALLYDPNTNEVIGIQVEAFQKKFLGKYSSLQNAWRLRGCCDDLTFTSFGDISIAFERQKPLVAHEVIKITEDLLFRKGRHLTPVPA